MAEAPYISGSELSSGQGNAALGVGGGVDFNFNPQNANPLGGINSTLERLQEQDYKNSVLQYEQGIKDRDALNQMLTYSGGSVANMKDANGRDVSINLLPDDQKYLLDKADYIRRNMGKNWSRSMGDPEIQKQISDYQRDVRHASSRAAALTQDQLDLSRENDPMERARMQENIQNEILSKKLTDYHQPQPHLRKLSFNPELFHSKKDMTDKDAMADYRVVTGKDDAGNLIYTTMRGLKDDIFDFRARAMRDSNLWADAQNMAASWIQHEGQNPEAIAKMNRNIDMINRQRGYVDAQGNPTSAHFIPYPAELVQGPNGEVNIKYNENPVNIDYAIMAEHNGQLQAQAKVEKTAQELEKQTVDIAKTKAEIAQGWRRLQNEEDKSRREYQMALAKGDKEDAKEKELDLAGYNANKIVHKAFDRYRKQGKPVLENLQEKINTELINQGIDPSQYKIVTIPQNDPDIKNMLAEPGIDVFSKINGTLRAPTEAYALVSNNGKIKDDVILAGFTSPGQKGLSYKIMTTSGAVSNYPISRKKGGKPTDKDAAKSERASDIYGDPEKAGAIWDIEVKEAPVSTANKSNSRPSSVPASAVMKSFQGKNVWVDNASRKIYDQNGIEVQRGG